MHVIHVHTESKSSFIARTFTLRDCLQPPALSLCASCCLSSCHPSLPLASFLPAPVFLTAAFFLFHTCQRHPHPWVFPMPSCSVTCPPHFCPFFLFLTLITLALSAGRTRSMFVTAFSLFLCTVSLLFSFAVHLTGSLPPPFLSSPLDLSLTLPFLLLMCVS